MPNVYTWYDDYRGSRMVAVGDELLFEVVYRLYKGYRIKTEQTLGQLMKFNAVDPKTFKGPFDMTPDEIDKKYGPVLTHEEIRQRLRQGLLGEAAK